MVSVASVVLALAALVFAAPGDLDTTFGAGGKVTTDFGSNDLGQAVAIQPDGQIVVAGSTTGSSSQQFALARYNSDGSLDPAFGGTGKVTTQIDPSPQTGARAFAVAVQPDSKIVAAGYSTRSGLHSAFARYNSDGTLDTSFNANGRIIITNFDRDGYGIIRSLAVQSDGKIVGAGYNGGAFTHDFVIVRLNPNGSLDPAFGGAGGVVTSISSTNNEAYAVALQSDGKIVAAGYSNNGSNDDFAVVRYNTDGSLDTTFGGTGKVTTPIGSDYDDAYAIAIQPDGKIVVAGASVMSSNDFALVRYNPDGSLDTTFNGTGKVITPIGDGNDVAQAVAIQPDGKIVAAGYSSNGANDDFVLARYNPDGSLDTTFHGIGKVRTPIGSSTDQAFGIAIQRNGRIVAAGYSFNGSNNDFALARYQAFTLPNHTANFDADQKTDISTWNPSSGNWYVINSSDGTLRAPFAWGSGSLGDIPVPGDYDGDGKTDFAVWRPSEGNWYITRSSDAAIVIRSWGRSGDMPVAGDYDGDGKTDLAVYRPSDGNWYILNSRDSTFTIKSFGTSTDKPVPADYDGDGRTDIAFYRPSEGNWYITNSRDGSVRVINWGLATDQPVPADYDGDGRADVAVWRPSEGNWYIRYWTNSATVRGWGASTDKPVPGDYDGDGQADIAVFRPSEGNWYIIQSSTNTLKLVYLGSSGDVPVPNAYLPQ
jgi:uncharacterized delta-60 repeat protein